MLVSSLSLLLLFPCDSLSFLAQPSEAWFESVYVFICWLVLFLGHCLGEGSCRDETERGESEIQLNLEERNL